MKHTELGDEETTRSGLFFEAIRLIKEMRKVEHRVAGSDDVVRYPVFAVYENVPGALSSGGGEDWRLVLEHMASIADEEVSIPRPAKGKWEHAGCIVGSNWSLAWRLMDAQYFGVPQRRKRVCCLLSLDEERERRPDEADNNEAVVGAGDAVCGRAGSILFESSRGCGDLDAGFSPWKGIARNPEESAGECDSESDYTLQVRCGNPVGGARAL